VKSSLKLNILAYYAVVVTNTDLKGDIPCNFGPMIRKKVAFSSTWIFP